MKNILIILLLAVFCPTQLYSQDCDLSMNNGFPNIVSPRCGDSNGIIEVKAIGSGPVSYKINDRNFQNSGLYENLEPGLYIIQMKDASGCTLEFRTILESKGGAVFQSVTPKASDCNQSNGEISIDATGTGLKYRLNNGPFQSSNSFSGLGGGKYTITIKDEFDCEAQKDVIVPEGSIALESIKVEHTSCAEEIGKITINATGNGQLQYRLVGITEFSNQSEYSNLSPGNYNIEIKEPTGCIIKRRVSVRVVSDFSVKVIDADCGLENGELIVSIFNEGTYKFSLNGGQTFNTTGHFTELAPGSYTLIVEADNGCSFQKKYTISEDPDIKNIKVKETPTACNSNTGQLQATAIADGLFFELLKEDILIDSNNSGLFSNLAIGNYIIKFTNDAGCEITKPATIKEDNDILVEGIDVTKSECIQFTGTIRINASSKIGSSLMYKLDNGEFSNTNIYREVTPGFHTITINSEAGCIYTEKVFVPPYINVSFIEILTQPPSSACSEDGKIIAKVNFPNVRYSLDGENFQDSNEFTGLNPGIFTVFIINEFGCRKESGEIVLEAAISIDEIIISEDYCKSGVGSLEIFATGRNLNYSLDGENYQEENLFNDLLFGEYTVYVRDGDLCVLTEDITIENFGEISIDNIEAVSTSCGENNGTATIFATSSSGTYSYRIDDLEFQESNIFDGLSAGIHTAYVQDEFGCTDSLTFEVPSSFPILPTYETTPSVCQYNNGTLSVSAEGGVGNFTFSFQNGPFSTKAQFENLKPGIYNIAIQDDTGCIVEQEVEVSFDCRVMFPNVIAPNGNGMNEFFRLLYFESLPVKEFVIFDSWGEEKYRKHNFQSEEENSWWGGNKNHMSGTYLAYVVYELNGEEVQYSGTFHLLK